ncbi:macrosialin [Pteronotus mesoamericanus]|uniref:macrosialin n=1 Tax=Pteronotus mesoamericanus TaxID=1884717 RepID=UPI0023EB1077|nr:macrosialin [Pteronotus parnellii mesoamericanus]
MKLAVLFLGAFLGLLAAQGTGNDCPHRKSATLLPSFTVTPTATESTSSPGTTSHTTTKSHRTTTRGTSHGPTTATHNPVTTTSHGNATGTSHGPTTATHNPVTTTSHGNATGTSHGPTTATHNPVTTTSHGNATAHPTSNSTATSPGPSSSAPHPGPPPPSPSPSPGSKAAVGDYSWTNGSQPCARLQAQIQIRVLYPTQDGKEAWGISVLNPNKTKAQGGCEGAHPHLLLSFPYGQLSFGFQQEPLQSTVYLNYMDVEYNVSFPQATKWTFSVQNSSLQELQAPLGQSFSCRNASIILSPVFHLDLLFLKLQAARLPPNGDFGPSFSCPSDQSISLPLIIGLIALGLLALVLVIFCIFRRRPPTYQPL